MASDLDLLQAWAGGSDDAGRELYHRYAHRITRFFARKLDLDVADHVQRTFEKCLAAKRKGTQVGDVGALLFAIARNELYDAIRARVRDATRFDPEHTTLADAATAPPARIARHEQQRLLLAALRRLPLEDQLAVELYYWEELSMEGLAQVLGVTRSAALSRVHRARDKLRKLIRTIEAAPEVVEDTLGGFETWARSLVRP